MRHINRTLRCCVIEERQCGQTVSVSHEEEGAVCYLCHVRPQPFTRFARLIIQMMEGRDWMVGMTESRLRRRAQLLLLVGLAAIIALILAFEDHGPKPFQLRAHIYETEGTLYSVVAKNGTFPYDYEYIVQVIPYRLSEEAMKTHGVLFGNAETSERVIYATDKTNVYRQKGAQLEKLALASLQEQVGKRAAFRVAAAEDGPFLVAHEFRILEDEPEAQPAAGEAPGDAAAEGAGEPSEEAGSPGDPPVWEPDRRVVTEEEVLQALDASFAAYHRIASPEGYTPGRSIAMLADHSVAYAAVKETREAEQIVYESIVYVLDVESGETRAVAAALPYRIEWLRADAPAERIIADYYDYEADDWRFASWDAATGEPIADPRDVLAENEDYTVFRSNRAPGLWAAAKAGGEPVRITEYGIDRQPLFYPGANRILYQAHTGRTIADGSGYGYVLAEYDLDTGEVRHYDYAIDGALRGWSEPGRSVLVDQAFNEGSSVLYTDPRIVDVPSLAERRLFGGYAYGDGSPYNMAYNEATGDLTVQIPQLFVHLERDGTIREITPWAYAGGEFTEAQPHPYSPDGTIRAYVLHSTRSAAYAESLVLADDANGRTTAYAAAALLAPLAWSPDSSHYAVLADTGFGIYAGVQETEAAFAPGGYF